MNTQRPVLSDVVSEAAAAGSILEPSALLAALHAESDPLAALAHARSCGSIPEAIEQDFGFIQHPRITGAPLNDGEHAKYVALIRWLIRSLGEWTIVADKHLALLATCLVTANCCGQNEGIWLSLPEDCQPSPEFVQALGKLIAARRVEFGLRGIGPAPIWESEFITAFQKADAAGDWAEIAARWPQMESASIPDFVLRESVRCLRRFGFNELVEAVDALSQTPIVMQIAVLLTDEERLRLALASNAARVRFCCAYVSLAQRRAPANVAPDFKEALCALFEKVAADPNEWAMWMTAFNTYPLRYPSLQESLGRALTNVTLEAVEAYIDSIKLNALAVTGADMSRSCVSACFRAFAQHAAPELRRAVWNRSFHRWRDWCFDRASRDTHLLEIQRSELDFAVVSYILECMDANARDAAVAAFRKELEQVELAWHATETDCITEWNRLLSLCQPYCRAMAIASSEGDAHNETRVYWPFDVSKSLYHRIMFRVNPASLGIGLQTYRSSESA